MTQGADEYCDVVMKGGITSGIVYPNAVLALAERYRFKNIGGTSAGAIAAAAAAAAALGERRKLLQPETVRGAEAQCGFAGLTAVAAQLRQRGFIFRLFRPARGGGAAFALITKLAAGTGPAGATLATLRALFAVAPVETLAILSLLLGLAYAVAGTRGIGAALLPALLCAAAGGLSCALSRTARIVRRNCLGLCAGTSSGEGGSALSEWLHQVLQQLSGAGERPLLFGDLWDAPRYPGEPEGPRALTLSVITSGLSHHEPRSVPFEGSRFWFRRGDFELLFPKPLVDWMANEDAAPLTVEGQVFHRLPEGARLPVLVAARMSLSFPLLISAVPLYEAAEWTAAPSEPATASGARDAGKPAALGEALAIGGTSSTRVPTKLRLCWFSDGGICSNFPIHLFDAALPRWPTFAIDLTYPGDDAAADLPEIFLPTENNQGWQRRYVPIAAGPALAEITRFLFTIVATMQNWRDLLQSRAPGHRDRIVHVALGPREGGMNLDMEQDVLDAIAAKGTAAGSKLVEDFDFANHWWVRWRNVASGVERFTIEVATGAGPALSPSYASARSSALTGKPPPPSYPFTQEQQRDAQARLGMMIEQGELWADTDPDLTRRAPRPLPQLRITPTY
jgi:predicted acylesterase/phospholipase RssA